MKKVSINPYFNPSKSMQAFMKNKEMFSLSFKYAITREEFRNRYTKDSSFLCRTNGTRLFISVCKGYLIDDVIREMEAHGFTVNTDRLCLD